MRPWEKRLSDLAHLLQNCHATYLDPDLFRMNTNQFLQTARTVTFLIQKNKDTIPGYDAWYAGAVIQPWGCDEVMRWAKEARNKVEKEGDLDLNSSLKLTLVFSYLTEEDAEIQCSKAELLHAGIKKLIRFAQKGLPSGVSHAAAVKIERRWVTAALPKWELLQALAYVYARNYDCCESLAKQFHEEIDKSIPESRFFNGIQSETRQVRYIKLNDLDVHSIKTETIKIDRQFKPPAAVADAFMSIHADRQWPGDIDGILKYYEEMATLTFSHFGNHVPMLFLFDKSWRPIDMVSTQFQDQADKFIFWRHVADRIAMLRASGIVWISESWIRSIDRSGATAIKDMPIKGERLNVVAIDDAGHRRQSGWAIIRQPDQKPTLQSVADTDETEKDMIPYYLVPALRAMGVDDIEFLSRKNVGSQETHSR